MNNFTKVKACLKTLGYSSLSSNNFEDKLVIQKVVFLLEMKGVKLSYPFGLHIRGPYSRQLTDDIYAHEDELKHLESKDGLIGPEIEATRELKESIELKPSQLEVAATYAYFAYGLHQDPITATSNVRRMKGFYPEVQIALGISGAKQFLFNPTKEELDQMKKEAEHWEKASDLNAWD